MKTFAIAMMLAVAPIATWAQESEPMPEGQLIVEAQSLDAFLWAARPIVVFADSPNDPRYIEQMDLLTAREDALLERDVVVITDTDTAEPSDIRQRLRPRGFSMVLIGKDGGVKLRKPNPWSVREIISTIDKMPMRQREMREAGGRESG